jgi:signal transduction histidine kinase
MKFRIRAASLRRRASTSRSCHELRTPLNAILGYTELIADGVYGEPSEKMLAVLKRLESNGKHLLGLINDVLDLSKIEADDAVHSQPVSDLNSLITGKNTRKFAKAGRLTVAETLKSADALRTFCEDSLNNRTGKGRRKNRETNFRNREFALHRGVRSVAVLVGCGPSEQAAYSPMWGPSFDANLHAISRTDCLTAL